MVEAAGQLIHLFQDGPDYAFTQTSNCEAWVRSVLSITRCRWILVPALLVAEVSRSMSLYRAGLRLALFLPLGVALASCDALGFTDVSSVFIPSLRTDATSFLIEPASENATQSGLHA